MPGQQLSAWASAGYVVAAVTFPRTTCHLATPDESDLLNQPADLACVIGQMLAVSGRPRRFLAGLIDPGNIAVAGHSDGGDTVAALAADTCCRDWAVTAAIVLAGAEWPPMGVPISPPRPCRSCSCKATPTTSNPPSDSIAICEQDTAGPRFYLDLPGAGHLPPYKGQHPAELVVARATTDFLDRYLAGSPGAAAAMRHDAQVAGVATLASGNQLPPAPAMKTAPRLAIGFQPGPEGTVQVRRWTGRLDSPRRGGAPVVSLGILRPKPWARGLDYCQEGGLHQCKEGR